MEWFKKLTFRMFNLLFVAMMRMTDSGLSIYPFEILMLKEKWRIIASKRKSKKKKKILGIRVAFTRCLDQCYHN
jgi:hypothetical protein